MPTLVHVTTVPQSLIFLRGQLDLMRARGLSVHAISSPGPLLDDFARELNVPCHAVEMPRRISPLADLRALTELTALLVRLKPDIVHAHTPKGGLLGMMAATLAGVPCRVYHMRGLPMMTATGSRRALLRATERVSCGLAHRVISVSHSLRHVAIEEGLCPSHKLAVMRGGSGNGVDAMGRFNPELLPDDARARARSNLGIPHDALVIGFVGRLVRDKGIIELAQAWRTLAPLYPHARLLIVGPFEERDPVPEHIAASLRDDARVHMTGFQRDLAALYSAMDLVTLPTYREGFPNVPLEAAAMGLPVVATQIPGCVDAIVDGQTGALVPPRDAEALTRALTQYLDDPVLRQAHGRAALARVRRDFAPQGIWEAIHAVYQELLDARA